METVTRLLYTQTEVMTAQAKAVAVQQLPALPPFTGEGRDIQDDHFDRWIQRFRERASFAGWTESDQLYQLKLHLDKTDLEDVFIAAHQKRFKPSDIEELRGLEFHHLMQTSETIEQLGIKIQQLGRKAFLIITGRDFDRLLKGRFYQALLVKWQRKLKSPRPEESFLDLLA